MEVMTPEFESGRKFNDLSQEEVFDRIISWLVQEGAGISSSERPTRIEAVHGSSELCAWDRNANKRLVIYISGTNRGTCVRIVASPASVFDPKDICMANGRTMNPWEKLSEELWKHVEGSGRAPTGGRYWTKDRSLSVLNKVAGIRIMMGGIILVTVGLLMAGTYSGAVLVCVIGSLTILWGAFKYWFGSK